MKKHRGKLGEFHPPENLPLEDLVLKTAVQYFGSELLPYLGIHEEIAGIAPTEQIHMEVRQQYEDFNYITKSGVLLHMEFESDSIRKADLRRFREYESTLSYTYRTEVVTFVICSSKVKVLLSELKEGINTYRIIPIRLKNWDADAVFKKLFHKKNKGKALKKTDLAPVLLTPLMSGKMSQKDRIVYGSGLVEQSNVLTKEEQKKMQAVLYVLANKFLEKEDLVKVKEVLSVTQLGEMLMRDGFEKGIEQGIEQGMEQGIEQGQTRVKRLIKLLLNLSRADEIPQVLNDEEYEKKLYKEFGI